MLAAATATAAALPAQAPAGFLGEDVATRELADVIGGRYAVYVDLDRKLLEFRQGDLVLWSAPIGIGKGIRLVTDDDDWHFTTPAGHYRVELKERDPVWIAPDWFFLENNRPIPAWNDPSRYFPGGLGAAAVYFHPELAIHGTDRTDLGVSHGCIRLSTRYALRLLHNVRIGTEVIIVGGEEARENARLVDLRDGYDPSIASVPGRPPPPDGVLAAWERSPTRELLPTLDAQLAVAESPSSRWDEIAVLLVDRAQRGDDEALAGLVARSLAHPDVRVEREMSTFIVDLYDDDPARTLSSIGALDPEARERAARGLVTAALRLFPGVVNGAPIAWPTGKIPVAMLDPEARVVRAIMEDAEREIRGQLGRNLTAAF